MLGLYRERFYGETILMGYSELKIIISERPTAKTIIKNKGLNVAVQWSRWLPLLDYVPYAKKGVRKRMSQKSLGILETPKL